MHILGYSLYAMLLDSSITYARMQHSQRDATPKRASSRFVGDRSAAMISFTGSRIGQIGKTTA